jgi:hypothetical protein
MEPEGLLPFPQASTAGPYAEPNKYYSSDLRHVSFKMPSTASFVSSLAPSGLVTKIL